MKHRLRVLLMLMGFAVGTVALAGCEEPTETGEPTESSEESAVEDEGAENEQGEQAEPEEEEDEHDVVESGTYEGTIKEVNAEEREIYVDVEGKELELYFIDETTLTRGEEEVEFSALEEGQSVKVEVRKVGQRLDPLSVTILE